MPNDGLLDSDCYLPARKVREVCGGVSDMTLYRWLKRDDLDFPRPVYICRRRYWLRDRIEAWLARQEDALPSA